MDNAERVPPQVSQTRPPHPPIPAVILAANLLITWLAERGHDDETAIDPDPTQRSDSPPRQREDQG